MKFSRCACFTLLASTLLLPISAFSASVQVGFSPEGSAEVLVLDVLSSAKREIRLMGYSFTSPAVVRELIAAKKRNVDVRVVLDAHGNEGKSSRAAMNLLVSAGIPVRTNDYFKIQHDKVIVADALNVQTGSFNYTASAARRNSENALVLWGAPDVAQAYLKHWYTRWDQGKDYQTGY